MGSLNLACPMCCDMTFNDCQALKYHLLSITENLYCPGCLMRTDSVSKLINHLDTCSQSSFTELDVNTSNANNSIVSNSKLAEEVTEMDSNDASPAISNDDFIIVRSVEDETKTCVVEVEVKGGKKIMDKMNIPGNNSETQIANSAKAYTSSTVNVKIPVAIDEEFLHQNHFMKNEVKSDNHSILPDFGDVAEESQDTGNSKNLLEIKEESCEETDAIYSCNDCGMSFISVKDHIQKYHAGQEVMLEVTETFDDFQGSVMNDDDKLSESVDNEDEKWRGEKMTESEKKVCDKSQKSLERNKAVTGMIKVYKCNECDGEFLRMADYQKHNCVTEVYQCDCCSQVFPTEKALQMHSRLHNTENSGGQNAYICTECGTEFLSHKSLRLHSRMHAPVKARHVKAPEGIEENTFTCNECGKVLSESYKAAHIALHEGDSVTCTICNRKFDSEQSLMMHAAVHTESIMNSHSPTPPIETMVSKSPKASKKGGKSSKGASTSGSVDPENKKPYLCQHCGRGFARPHEKVKHERIHTGEKPHACEVCGKTFRVSYCLTLHMRTHTGVRPYECKHCKKRFKASSVYNHHLLTHGEERAYSCPYCPKTFKTRVQLAGHKNSHTKPFRCPECSRPFASLYAARSHMATHQKHNNLKFNCYICGASYGRAFALKDHMKQHDENVGDSEMREEFVIQEVENEELVVPSPLGEDSD